MHKNADPNESIGRPAEWTQERYRRAEDPIENAVNSEQDEKELPDEASAPVTIADYETKESR